ncbi:MAG TPA: hypothetical protein EYQ50_21380 [Verrucomicrobiales bacterium]|nr:hypothetical protein [Verrucomicrobiales bacterium]
MKLPYGGIRPQAAIDEAGVVHIIQSDSKVRGQLVYVKHMPDRGEFSEPVNVLRKASEMAAGYNMTVSKDGRVHVLTRPNPKYSKWALGEEKFTAMFKSKARFFVLRYMLHSRLNDDGSAFEDEINIVGDTIGFEGVGAIAADPNGPNVYAFWAGQMEPGPEMGRVMYMAVSKDEGKNWSMPIELDIDIEGNCRCCPIQATMDAEGGIYLVHRNSVKTSATSWDKDTFLLVSKDSGKTWNKTRIQKWEKCGCPGAPYSMASGPEGVYFGFSTRGISSFAKAGDPLKIIPAPKSGKTSMRPMLATNKSGEVLFTWVEMQDIAWQVFDKHGKAIDNAAGRLDGAAAKWSHPAVVAVKSGDFLLYHDGITPSK